MKKFKRIAIAAAVSLPVLVGCVNPNTSDDPNAATKQGAAGGALLGLTMGALTGDAELAMKGAIAGGVAGGVAGAGADINNNRENIRHDSRNVAISGVGSSSAEASPQVWAEIDRFIGNWNVNIQNVDIESEFTELQATGSLTSISDAEVTITTAENKLLDAKFSYDAKDGYGLKVTNEATATSISFSGEKQGDSQRYHFYPNSTDNEVYAGIPASDTRIELGLISANIWVIDSYAFINGEEKKVQTFRFTKQS
ncbi:hypothetical protein MACH09_30390 [Vibrio sp. MACH09]|uniref:hypothetical protein n=1 Tax=unclassified Vibrio TaxID=2614977 RepID=UPI0014937E4F|nr:MULTISPECIES: hypothetical protein [unclassified Vibrio]NOI65054.1 hypothetical protein [Vibrio sp. 99-8-1]GLO62531.1 hypothetical protein MACH09_30390 [Vibrio sp. MACH09]